VLAADVGVARVVIEWTPCLCLNLREVYKDTQIDGDIVGWDL
jgi:hypothetical protein